MNSTFSEQLLAERLSKLNSTQQCIETLSHWCIFHRSKAQVVVATWDKQFHISEMVQKVPLLYLANDILQNSKRNGNEFVTEFWKVLPAALKDVAGKGDDRGKDVVSRLVAIWVERRVFGSRGRSLKDVMLSEDVPAPLELIKKHSHSRSIRIVKRDSCSIRMKLSIGGTAEKIVSAFHLVLGELPSEEVEMSNCRSAVHHIRKIEKDAGIACVTPKDPKRKTLAKELGEEENILKQCIRKLKSVEASRAALVFQLKEALHEQESELENVHTQMQVAGAQVEEASNMRRRLNDEDWVSKPSSLASSPVDVNVKAGETPGRTTASIAAEVADKLTASSSSQMIMHSVLSTFAAQEAKNVGLTKAPTASNSATSISISSASDSASRSENSVPVSDPNVFMPAPHTGPSNHTYQSVFPQQTLQNQTSAQLTQYHILPTPPSQQYNMQPSAGLMPPFGYTNIPHLPPGPPLPPHMVSTMMPFTLQQPLSLAQQPNTLIQQPPGPPSFRPLQPPGVVYYGHPHHS